MTVHLLNAAVMPQPGFYELRDITIDKFIDAVRGASEAGTLLHHIGYEETLKIVEALCKITLGDIRVAETKLTDGDALLIIKLRRRTVARDRKSTRVRTVHAGTKGARLPVSDYVFIKGHTQRCKGKKKRCTAHIRTDRRFHLDD